MKKKKFYSILIIVIILLVVAFAFKKGNILHMKGSYALEEGLTDADKTNGIWGNVVETLLVNRVTGTGPFDEDNEPGNDTDGDNNIVRSFDQITWTYENTMNLIDNPEMPSYTGGVLMIKAELPIETANYVKWDLDSMNWIENGNVSNDGRILTGYYRLSESEITLPGKQNTNYVLNVLAAPNGLEIQPTFTISLYGDAEGEEIVTTAEKITVSAAPRYNVHLKRNGGLSAKATVEIDGESITGRMYGYAITIELYNQNQSKKLKGIELPKNEIEFDIDLKLERQEEGSDTLEDITDDCTPILWNYDINGVKQGKISGRGGMFGGDIADGLDYYYYAPSGTRTSNRFTSVYNSGNILMNQIGKKIKTNITGYDFDLTFPNHYTGNWNPTVSPTYGENEGIFHVSYFQILVPDNETSTEEGYNYYLTVSDNNFKATSLSNIETNTQELTSDDSERIQHLILGTGTHSQFLIPLNKNNKRVWSATGAGDSKFGIGEKIQIGIYTSLSKKSDITEYHALSKFLRFDGDCVEPILYDDNRQWKIYNQGTEDMNLRVWYITKPDGTNWTNQNEMNHGNIADMNYYADINDVPEGAVIVGEYFESDSGTFTRGYNGFKVRFKIKENVPSGKVCSFTQRSQVWIEDLDRNTYSITKNNFSSWPTPTYDSGDSNYVPTAYDENGQIMSGTYTNGNYRYGQSILVMGGEQVITKKAIDKETTEAKVNYDLGKNENIVTYKLEPSLVSNISNINITNVNLKIEDTLPQGLRYVGGSSNYEEPEITENSDGTTTLTWYKYGCTVNEDIDAIIYDAHIDEESPDGKTYDTEVIMSEIASDGIYKVGNESLKVSRRKAQNSIQIINLLSYNLYKVTDTPVVEVNDNGNYKVVVSNKTNNDVTTFRLLDILPYNGDSRETNYTGEYEIKKITINQINTSNNENISIDNLNLNVTTNENVRNKEVNDGNLDSAVTWENVVSGSEINRKITGILLKGTLKAYSKIEITIEVTMSGNKARDAYVNSATAITNPAAAPMVSPNAKIEVVDRIIEGTVWHDVNENGLLDDNELLMKEQTVKLYNEAGTLIKTTITDNTGKYEFTNLAKDNYKVKIEYDEKYKVTAKEVGTNREINSKTNSDGQTDLIETLNSISSPIIKESHVNQGLILKNAKLKVKYLEKGTNQVLAEEYEENYKYGETYEAINGDGKVDNKYREVEISGSVTGIVNQDIIEVIYYYEKRIPGIEDQIEKTGTELITKAGEKVEYNIKYKARVTEYMGTATITLTDILPFEIDINESELDGGTYDNETKKISWVVQKEIQSYDEEVEIEKNITVLYRGLDIKQRLFTNIINGELHIESMSSTIETAHDTEQKIPGTLIVKYVDEEGKELSEEEIIKGLVGEIKESHEKEIKGYILKEEPEVRVVELIDGTIEHIYVYTRLISPQTGIELRTFWALITISIVIYITAILIIIRKKAINNV